MGLLYLPVEEPPVAFAAGHGPTIAMTSTVGYSGYYSKDRWVPVDVVIQNRGPAVKATLSLDVNQTVQSGRVALGTLRWSTRLPADGWHHVHIYVPGSLMDGTLSIDCLVDGQAVATTFLGGNEVSHVALVAVLSDKAQDAQFLTGSTDGQKGDPVLPVPVNPASFPVQSNLLDELTAVVSTPDELSRLDANQSTALRTWVRMGGMLIVTGITWQPTDWSAWFPFLPGVARRVPGKQLAVYIGNLAVLPGKIDIAVEHMQPGTTLWAGTPQVPLIGDLTEGRGQVVQTSFSPLLPTLLGWSGNAEVWTSVLGQSTPVSDIAEPPVLSASGLLSLTAVSDTLSPIRVPSLRFWLTVFVLYGLLLGPVLFFALRRYKKEPWAWIILPVVGVFTTVAIYGFGANQRPTNVLTAGLGVLDLTDTKTAETYGVRAFMSPYPGSISANLDSGMSAFPLVQQNVRDVGSAVVDNSANPSVRFSGEGRWGVRYVVLSGEVHHQGMLETHLWGSVDSQLFGTVQNGTPYPLHNVGLLWNNRLYELGDIPRGGTVSISAKTPMQMVSSSAFATYGVYNHDLTRGYGRPLGNLVAQYLFDLPTSSAQAMLVATTPNASPILAKIQTHHPVNPGQTLMFVRQFTGVSVRME